MATREVDVANDVIFVSTEIDDDEFVERRVVRRAASK